MIVPEISAINERLQAALTPTQIYLFGSYARDSATPDSDYDFYVVVPDDAGNNIELAQKAYRALRGFGESQWILSWVMRPTLTGRHRRTAWNGLSFKRGCCSMPHNKLVSTWFSFAETDLLAARHLYETMYPQPYEIICYHCQQAVEKPFSS